MAYEKFIEMRSDEIKTVAGEHFKAYPRQFIQKKDLAQNPVISTIQNNPTEIEEVSEDFVR